MARKTQTIKDFPPEFMNIWELAAAGKLMLSFDEAGTARNMIQRLYTFRKRLMEEAPQLAERFYLVDLRVHDEAGNVIVGRKTAVPGKAIVKTYIPTWKEQVRKQLSSSESGVLTEVPALVIAPEGLDLPLADTPAVQTSVDHQEETLSDLGYGTGESK
jgi:hypothetical protein